MTLCWTKTPYLTFSRPTRSVSIGTIITSWGKLTNIRLARHRISPARRQLSSALGSPYSLPPSQLLQNPPYFKGPAAAKKVQPQQHQPHIVLDKSTAQTSHSTVSICTACSLTKSSQIFPNLVAYTHARQIRSPPLDQQACIWDRNQL